MKKLFIITALVLVCVKGYSSDVWINANPVVKPPSTTTNCFTNFVGEAAYLKTAANGWGWKPSTNTTIHTITDTNRSDTRLAYLGKFSDPGCGPSVLTLPAHPPSPAYRFGVWFPDNVNTNAYWIKLSGFDP